MVRMKNTRGKEKKKRRRRIIEAVVEVEVTKDVKQQMMDNLKAALVPLPL